MNNPIATLGDGDGTTRDADCMFLRYQMGEVKKLRSESIAEMVQQQELLAGNWRILAAFAMVSSIGPHNLS
jgi:hypothetical protein